MSKEKPMRRCIACMESKAQDELFRLVDEGETISFDFTRRKAGRGAYVCKCKDCFDRACNKRAFERVFKRKISQANIEMLRGEFDAKIQV
ncbi:hypothetical protein HMPREF0380_01670 [Eubacterium infirmum F0142]|nr:hypothetical protein HMPREF0380_01670 [Eubacterium infirmum F0142]